MAVENTLAYYDTAAIMTKGSFIVLALEYTADINNMSCRLLMIIIFVEVFYRKSY